MWKWAGVALLALTGCSSRGALPRVNCQTSCAVEYKVRIDPAFTEEEQKDIWYGLYSWSAATKGAVCYVPQTPQGFNLVIIRGETQLALRPYIDHHELYAGIHKDGTIVVAMDVGRHELDSIIAHEAGHALGLPHAPSASSVMHYRNGKLLAHDLPPSDRLAFNQSRCK